MRQNSVGSALAELVRKGWLSEDSTARLVDQSLSGEHVLFVGPNKAARMKLAESLASDVGQIARVWTKEDPSITRASLAGADYVFAPEMAPDELPKLMANEPQLGIIASLTAFNAENIVLALSEQTQAVALARTLSKSLWTVGFDLEGRPRLITSGLAPEAIQQAKAKVKPLPVHLPRSWESETMDHEPGWELEGDGW